MGCMHQCLQYLIRNPRNSWPYTLLTYLLHMFLEFSFTVFNLDHTPCNVYVIILRYHFKMHSFKYVTKQIKSLSLKNFSFFLKTYFSGKIYPRTQTCTIAFSNRKTVHFNSAVFSVSQVTTCHYAPWCPSLFSTHSLYHVPLQTTGCLTSNFTISWGFSWYLPLICNGMIIINLISAYSKTW